MLIIIWLFILLVFKCNQKKDIEPDSGRIFKPIPLSNLDRIRKPKKKTQLDIDEDATMQILIEENC